MDSCSRGITPYHENEALICFTQNGHQDATVYGHTVLRNPAWPPPSSFLPASYPGLSSLAFLPYISLSDSPSSGGGGRGGAYLDQTKQNTHKKSRNRDINVTAFKNDPTPFDIAVPVRDPPCPTPSVPYLYRAERQVRSYRPPTPPSLSFSLSLVIHPLPPLLALPLPPPPPPSIHPFSSPHVRSRRVPPRPPYSVLSRPRPPEFEPLSFQTRKKKRKKGGFSVPPSLPARQMRKVARV